MKKPFFLILAILGLATLGCTSDVSKVKTSINGYYYYTERFQEACPSYDSKDCPDLKGKAEGLKRWNKAIKEAGAAIERGGKLPLQLKALKDAEKGAK